MKLWVYVPTVTNEMLPSSSTTPEGAVLVSSEALTVMTPAERSSQDVESKDSTTESKSDSEVEGYLSENDLEITGEQSHASRLATQTSQTLHHREGPQRRPQGLSL